MARHALHAYINKRCGREHSGNMAKRLWVSTPDTIILRNNELDGNPHIRSNLWKTCTPFLRFYELWHGARNVPFWVQLRQFFWIRPGWSIHDSDLNRLIHNYCRCVVHQGGKCG